MATATNTSALSDMDCEMVKHIIDVKELENLKWSECSIYKVPSNLRKVNMQAYTPQLISIGPIHFRKKKLKPMQEQKVKYLNFFRQNRVPNGDLKGYKDYLEGEEEEIRKCYAQKLPRISKDEFVEMILLDAVFIMEHILRTREWKLKYTGKYHKMDSKSFRETHKDHYVLTQSWLSKSLHRDLLLLENQIPMFVLEALYEIAFPRDDKKPDESFLYLAFEYFAIYEKSSLDSKLFTSLEVNSFDKLIEKLKKLKKAVDLTDLQKLKEPKHFTDLIRCFYLPTNLSCKHSPASVLRTVTKLQQAGVSFEKGQKSSLLDVEFEKKPILSWFLCLGCFPCFKYCKASLVIPQLKVEHTTECVFRNLIAFEQCHYPLEPYICNYVSMLDSLIHTTDDVELLVEKEVIVHELGSDREVASLVNGLCKHVVTHTTCYGKVINGINQQYQNSWYHYMAKLRLVYFRDPWRTSSTMVGIAILAFTIFSFCRGIKLLA